MNTTQSIIAPALRDLSSKELRTLAAKDPGTVKSNFALQLADAKDRRGF